MISVPDLFGDGQYHGDAEGADLVGTHYLAGDGEDYGYMQHYLLSCIYREGRGFACGYWTSAEPLPLLELMESAGLIDRDIANVTRLAT